MTTPRLGAPELPTGQNASPSTMNEALRWVEQGANKFIVKDKDLATPPGSPSAGDCYIVAGSPTGAWTGWATRLAFRLASSWEDITPIEGTQAYVQDENLTYTFDGAAWAADPASSITGAATAAQIRTGTSNVTFVSPLGVFESAEEVTLTSSASVTPDFSTGLNFVITLAHDGQLENPTNAKEGQSGLIKITQDGTGNQTWTYGTNWKFPGGAPVLSTAAGAIDLLAFHVWSSNVITATLTKAYAS